MNWLIYNLIIGIFNMKNKSLMYCLAMTSIISLPYNALAASSPPLADTVTKMSHQIDYLEELYGTSVDHFNERMDLLNSDLKNNMSMMVESTKNIISTQNENKMHAEQQAKTLEEKLIESEKIISMLIEDVGSKSHAYTDLQLQNKHMLNTEHINRIENQFNHQFKQMDNKINRTAKQANSGIASVAAMANIPYSTKARFSAGIGLGHYKNGKAVAAGAQYQIRQNVSLRSSLSWNNGNSPVMGAGISWGW